MIIVLVLQGVRGRHAPAPRSAGGAGAARPRFAGGLEAARPQFAGWFGVAARPPTSKNKTHFLDTKFLLQCCACFLKIISFHLVAKKQYWKNLGCFG